MPLSVCVLNGRARFGYARFGEGEVYNTIKNQNGGNIDDAIIADTSVYEGCILITEDNGLYSKMKTNDYDVMKFSEFIDTLK